jgi:hypothetical protein
MQVTVEHDDGVGAMAMVRCRKEATRVKFATVDGATVPRACHVPGAGIGGTSNSGGGAQVASTTWWRRAAVMVALHAARGSSGTGGLGLAVLGIGAGRVAHVVTGAAATSTVVAAQCGHDVVPVAVAAIVRRWFVVAL